MEIYLDLVILLNFLVDFFLLKGANRLAGFPDITGRIVFAACVGGIYGGICLLPGFRFLGSFLWRITALAVISLIAYGWGMGTLRRGILFLLLSMAMGGIAIGLGNGSFLGVAGAAAAVGAMCVLGFRGKVFGREYVPVELAYGGKSLRLLALRDTGNTLTDPVTGQSVLVIDAKAAEHLLGLSASQLGDPIEAVRAAVIPGLRLLPYRSIGKSAGMLVALRLEKVRIGEWEGSALVAFAPHELDGEGTYQALTGGLFG